jgi:hypothetical protein
MHDQRICRFLTSAVLMLAPSAFAKTLYVGTCHTPSYNTISDAVAAAAADTIDVCPGIYAEQVFIYQQLWLLGITSSGGHRARCRKKTSEGLGLVCDGRHDSNDHDFGRNGQPSGAGSHGRTAGSFKLPAV